MFTILDTFESYPMDENDRKILKEMLEIAMKDSVFQWLKDLPLDRISFRFHTQHLLPAQDEPPQEQYIRNLQAPCTKSDCYLWFRMIREKQQ